MSKTALQLICLFLCLTVFSSVGLAAPKTDVIRLKNGDRITGEIKSLLRGKLELKTDHMGTVLIDWVDIQEVVSNTSQAIELSNGTRFFGPLEKAGDTEVISIGAGEGAVAVDSLDVIAMYPVEASFWQRLDLSIKLGFSWDKASGVGRANFGLDAVWRDPRFITRGSFSTEITTQESREDALRSVLSLNHMRFLRNKRFRSAFGSLERNDELGLNLRALAGAGYGWIPVRSQSSLLGLMAGLNVNQEVPQTGDPETSLELVGSLMYDYFIYSHPERRFNLALNVYPSITEGGRYRASLDSTFKVEIFSDLYWDLTMYSSYDNKPLSIEASKSDYGIASSLGYKF